MTNPIQIFIAYARKDAAFLEELRVQLKPLERSGKVKIWYDGKIEPGEIWEAAIKTHLHQSDIILLMVSADAIASDYFYEKEMADALERHHSGKARVVPFIIRPCAWKATPLAALQALPQDGVAVTRWPNRDHAYADAVNALLEMIESLEEKRKAAQAAEALSRRQREEEAQRLKAEALVVQQEREQLQRKKEEQARQAKEKKLKAEAERQHQQKLAEQRQRQEKARKQQQQERKEALLAQLRSPMVWGSAIVIIVIFLGLQLCKKNKIESPKPQEANSTKTFDPLPKGRKSGLHTKFIKGGTFQMGSPEIEEFRDSDECLHKVKVKNFYLAKYEITQADWKEVMGENPSGFKGCAKCPVESVSWKDVELFINKARDKYGVKFRLPAEAEWEYAARGGKDVKGFNYAGSNDPEEVVWYNGNSDGKTHPVGSKQPNELGLYDMSGNVWEWCADNWQPYPNCTAHDCPGCRVVRGGSWYSDDRDCRSAGRNWVKSSYQDDDVGLRLARD